jgi:hypothetical protein
LRFDGVFLHGRKILSFGKQTAHSSGVGAHAQPSSAVLGAQPAPSNAAQTRSPTPRKYHRACPLPALVAVPREVASLEPPALAPPPITVTSVASPIISHLPLPSSPVVAASTPDGERPRRPDWPVEADGSRELGGADLLLPPYEQRSPILPTLQPQAHWSASTLLQPGLRHRASGVPARANALGVRRPAGVQKPIQAALSLVAPSEYTLSVCALVYIELWH